MCALHMSYEEDGPTLGDAVVVTTIRGTLVALVAKVVLTGTASGVNAADRLTCAAARLLATPRLETYSLAET